MQRNIDTKLDSLSPRSRPSPAGAGELPGRGSAARRADEGRRDKSKPCGEGQGEGWPGASGTCIDTQPLFSLSSPKASRAVAQQRRKERVGVRSLSSRNPCSSAVPRRLRGRRSAAAAEAFTFLTHILSHQDEVERPSRHRDFGIPTGFNHSARGCELASYPGWVVQSLSTLKGLHRPPP
jgi:hypothetical protein